MGTGRALQDLTDRRFGRLLVLQLSRKERVYPDRTTTRIFWLCRCDCGAEVEIPSSNLRGGQKSCGCDKWRAVAEANTKHGGAADLKHGVSTEYRTWRKIKERCLNERDKSYPRYGGAGITICDEWRDDFLAFLKHVGKRPTPRHSMDRINGKLGYQPGNVRWATPRVQGGNTTRVRSIEIRGVVRSVRQWARFSRVSYAGILQRLNLGWLPEDAVFAPKRKL